MAWKQRLDAHAHGVHGGLLRQMDWEPSGFLKYNIIKYNTIYYNIIYYNII